MVKITWLSITFLAAGFGFTKEGASLPLTLAEMVFVEGGKMEIGGKSINVRSFYMDKYEVTLADFQKFTRAKSYVTVVEKTGGATIWKNKKWTQEKTADWRHNLKGELIPDSLYAKIPVTNIAIADAQAYAAWAGKRLPTLEEWVYAAKGGKKSMGYRYAGSNKADKVAWHDGNSLVESPRAIGTKLPNELGIYDLGGNVHEFVVAVGNKFFARGGCFFSDKEFCEVKSNGWEVKGRDSFPTYGFRCVKDGN